jgi:riboflavin synthase
VEALRSFGVRTLVDIRTVPRSRHVPQFNAETLRRTTLGQLRPGVRVNLERPLAIGDRLGGHLVQGHVDGVGRVLERREDGAGWWVEISVPSALARYVVEKGSITVDGVSLTVASAGADRFGVSLIPHTCAVTTLGGVRVDAHVNLEVDVLAKYVERLVGAYAGGASLEERDA